MKQDKLLEYYFLARNDLKKGASIQEMEDAIAQMEEEENFEACAGILKAIEEVKYKIIKNLKNGN